MEKPKTANKPGLVPNHSNGNGFHGTENTETQYGLGTYPNGHLVVKESVGFLISEYQKTSNEDQTVVVDNQEVLALGDEISDLKELSPRQLDYYRVVASLINQPEFTFRHPENAGGEFAKQLGFQPRHWEEIYRKLKNRRHVIDFEKKDGKKNSRLSTAVSLSIKGFIAHAKTAQEGSFTTINLLKTLQARLTDEDIQLSKEERIKYSADINELIQKRLISKPTPEELAEDKRRRDIEANRRWRAKNYKPKKPREKASITKPTQPQQDIEFIQTETKETPGHRKPDKLFFNFLIEGGGHFIGTYKAGKFSEFDPMIKLLHAVGHSSAFASNKQQQDEYASRLLNRKVEGEDRFDEKSFQQLLAQAEEKGLIAASGSIFNLTAQAFDELQNFKTNLHRLRSSAGKSTGEKREQPKNDSAQETPTIDTEQSSDISSYSRFYFMDQLIPAWLAERIRQGEFEKVEWLYANNNRDPVTSSLAQLHNLSDTDMVAKKLRLLRNVGYAKIEIDIDGKIINFGFTEEAMHFWKDYEDQEIEEKLNKNFDRTDEINVLDSLTIECLQIAKGLGKSGVIDHIKEICETDEYINLTEHNRNFVKKEIQRMRIILDELQKEKDSRTIGSIALAA